MRDALLTSDAYEELLLAAPSWPCASGQDQVHSLEVAWRGAPLGAACHAQTFLCHLSLLLLFETPLCTSPPPPPARLPPAASSASIQGLFPGRAPPPLLSSLLSRSPSSIKRESCIFREASLGHFFFLRSRIIDSAAAAATVERAGRSSTGKFLFFDNKRMSQSNV